MLKRTYLAIQTASVVLVDRDGVINERNPSGHVLSWEQFHFKPGAVEALTELARNRLPVVIVSNQSCISRSLISREELAEIMQAMSTILIAKGVILAAWYCCPHGPEDGCHCRKPMPGMLMEASRDLGVELESCYLVGDKQWDLDAGIEAGCRISIEIDEYDPKGLERAVAAICADRASSTRD